MIGSTRDYAMMVGAMDSAARLAFVTQQGRDARTLANAGNAAVSVKTCPYDDKVYRPAWLTGFGA